MSQLHSSILSKRKCEEIEKAEIQYKRICHVAPVQPYEEDRMQEVSEPLPSTSNNEIYPSTINNLAAEESEDPETINDDIVDDPEDYWSRVIENWIDMLDAENHVDNEEIMDNETLEFEFGGRIIHPAEDLSAK
ncbi:4703_t:CDS:1 [Scutellospora calospora]|uniref:4703_t:CDS:1 n=1 Tax=Scutellospora calospora TaxID=85575 RepID=A0ACA9LT78_9GLOM|nr:4703_t:CDS:1 [Scutellospora calospora]